MTFEEWLLSKRERVEVDLQVDPESLIEYLEDGISKYAVEDLILFKMSAYLWFVELNYKSSMEYINKIIDGYKEEYNTSIGGKR